MGGHYLYVDRNLIELLAACVIATSGTGKWVGVDAYLVWMAWYRRRAGRAAVESEVTVSAR